MLSFRDGARNGGVDVDVADGLATLEPQPMMKNVRSPVCVVFYQ